MNELQLNNHLSFPKCKFTPQSLEIDPSASYDEWAKIGNFLNTIEGV